MISVICGTNRKSSNSLLYGQALVRIFEQNRQSVQLLNLKDLPNDFVFENEVYGKKDAPVNNLAEQYISGAEKFVFVIPEYNGSFPGVLKAFIDAFMPERIRGKKALIFGISSGRAGNVRGLDHFTGVLNYLGVHVQPTKIAISQCHKLIDYNSGEITDEVTLDLMEQQVKAFISA